MSTQTNNENHIVTPTYQSILINTISTVIERMNNTDPFGAWLALRNLYRWLPKECKDEVKPKYDEIAQQLANINKTSQYLDMYTTRSTRHTKQKQFLLQANEILSESISESMRLHNWLDRDGTIRARIDNKPTLKIEAQ
jgi:hypothetical protein